MPIFCVIPPTPFDSLETWLEHREWALRLPDDERLKTMLIEDADEVIADLKAGRTPDWPRLS